MHGGIEHGVSIGLAQPSVALIAVGVAGVTHATADTEAVEYAVVPGVIGPQRGLLVRHELQAVAFVVAFLHFGLGQGVGGNHFQVVGDVRGRLQFQAFDFHFAGLAGDRGVADGGGDCDVFLRQVIHGGGQQGLAARWLVLDAHFPLLAFGRLQRTGGGGVGAGGGLEGFGVGNVRDEARVEHVAERCVTAEVLVALGVGRVGLVEEFGAGVDPVFTTAQRQAPLVEGHLVLHVEAGLVGLLVVVVIRRRAIRTNDRLAVDRLQHVGFQTVTVDRQVVGVAALVIQPQQYGVANVTGGEVGLEVVVHRELADVFVNAGAGAPDVALIVHLGVRVRTDGQGLERQIRLGVTQILLELPDIVQPVFKRITERVVSAVVVFPIRVAEVFVVRNATERHVDLGALHRQELAGNAGIVAGELAQQGESGVVVNVPGQARRDVVALVFDVIDLCVAVAHHTADAVEKLAGVVDLAGAGEVDLAVVVAAVLQLDFAAGVAARAPADHVQQAARWGLAVDGGGRAAQQGEAIEVPGFLFRVGVHAFWQWQPIEELGRLEATHAQPVGAGVAAVAAGGDARHITHGVIEAVHAAVVHLLTGGDRDRARCFDQRGVGLGTGGGAGGGVALDRAPGRFKVFHADHGSFRQRQCPFRHGNQAVGASAALFQLQTGALQRCAQSAGGVVLPVDRRRGLARRQRRIERQREATLAGDLVQRGRQRRRWQVVGTYAGGLFSSEQRAAEQRRAEGNGDGQQTGAQQGV